MDIKYGDYLDESTRKILEIVSSPDIEEEERNVIVSAFSDELVNSISDTSNLRDCDLLIYSVSLKYIDSRLSRILADDKVSYAEYEKAIRLCKRQRELIQLFTNNKWDIPPICNTELRQCEDVLRKRQESDSISSKIIEEDQRIDELMRQAQAELSVQACNLLFGLLNELESDIEMCKKKKTSLPEIRNKNTKKIAKRVMEIKKIAEQKEILHQSICELDLQIDGIISLQKTTPEQWQEVISLCQEQIELLSECNKKQWSLPLLKCSSPSDIIMRYKHYQTMVKLDNDIISNRDALSTRKQYKAFYGNCSQQKSNIETCERNNWKMPDLEVINPAELSKIVQAERHKKEKTKTIKRTLILTGTAITALITLIIFGVQKYREGKVQIPFDASYAFGESLDTIYNELDNAGFENIIKKQDTSGWQNSDEVLNVTIDNLSNYKKDSYKKADVSVVITYSSSGRIYVTDMLKDWKKSDYLTLAETLRSAGFTNVITKEIDTADKQQDHLISALELNGINYMNEHCYLPFNAPIVISYYSLKIGIGNSNIEFIGQDYQTVVTSLTERGFTNVHKEAINTGFAKGKTIVGVTVNNVDTYGSGETFAPDVKIVVKYSSDNRADATKCLESWQSKDYETILTNLKNKGFSNVTTHEKITSDKTVNHLVVGITINDEVFQSGDCFVKKNSPIVIEYYVLNIIVGQTASSLTKNNELAYVGVVEQLRNLGFTNIQLLRTDDLINGWITKEGSIDSITINGNSDFSETDSFRYDVPIVIVVHTFKGKGCDDITVVAD